MTNVLRFPSQRTQGLAFLDQQIRELLAARGADDELIDFAAKTVRDVYERCIDAEDYSFNVALPPGMSDDDAEQLRQSIKTGVEHIRSENHAVVVRLIAELTMAEVKVFQARRES